MPLATPSAPAQTTPKPAALQPRSATKSSVLELETPLSVDDIHEIVALDDILSYICLGRGWDWGVWARKTTKLDESIVKHRIRVSTDDKQKTRESISRLLHDPDKSLGRSVASDIRKRVFAAWQNHLTQTLLRIDINPPHPSPSIIPTFTVIADADIALEENHELRGFDYIVLEAPQNTKKDELTESGLNEAALVRTTRNGQWKVCLGPGTFTKRVCDTCFNAAAIDEQAAVFTAATSLTWEMKEGDELLSRGGEAVSKDDCPAPAHAYNIVHYGVPSGSRKARSLCLCKGWDADPPAQHISKSKRPSQTNSARSRTKQPAKPQSVIVVSEDEATTPTTPQNRPRFAWSPRRSGRSGRPAAHVPMPPPDPPSKAAISLPLAITPKGPPEGASVSPMMEASTGTPHALITQVSAGLPSASRPPKRLGKRKREHSPITVQSQSDPIQVDPLNNATDIESPSSPLLESIDATPLPVAQRRERSASASESPSGILIVGEPSAVEVATIGPDSETSWDSGVGGEPNELEGAKQAPSLAPSPTATAHLPVRLDAISVPIDNDKEQRHILTFALDGLHASYQRMLREQRVQSQHDVLALRRSLQQTTQAIEAHRVDADAKLHQVYAAHDAAVAERDTALRERNQAVQEKAEILARRDCTAADRAEAHRRLQTVLAESASLSQERDWLLIERNQTMQDQAELRLAKNMAQKERDAAVATREEQRDRAQQSEQRFNTLQAIHGEKVHLQQRMEAEKSQLHQKIAVLTHDQSMWERKAANCWQAYKNVEADRDRLAARLQLRERADAAAVLREAQAVPSTAGDTKEQSEKQATDTHRSEAQDTQARPQLGSFPSGESGLPKAAASLQENVASVEPSSTLPSPTEIAPIRAGSNAAPENADTSPSGSTGPSADVELIPNDDTIVRAQTAVQQRGASDAEADALASKFALVRSELERMSARPDTAKRELEELRVKHASLRILQASIVNEMQKYKSDSQAFADALCTVKAQLDLQLKATETAKTELVAMTQRYSSAREHCEGLEKQLEIAIQERDAAKVEVQTVKIEVAVAESNAERLNAELEEYHTNHSLLQEEQQFWDARLKYEQHRREAAEVEVQTVKNELSATQSNAERLSAELEEYHTNTSLLRDEQRRWNATLKHEQEQREAAELEVQTVKTELGAAQSDVERLSTELEEYLTNNSLLQDEQKVWNARFLNEQQQREAVVAELSSLKIEASNNQKQAQYARERLAHSERANEMLKAVKDGILIERDNLIAERQQTREALSLASSSREGHIQASSSLDEWKVEKEEILAAKLLYEQVTQKQLESTAEASKRALVDVQAAEESRDLAIGSRDKEVERRQQAEAKSAEMEVRIRELEAEVQRVSTFGSARDSNVVLSSPSDRSEARKSTANDSSTERNISIKELKDANKQLRRQVRGLTSANATLQKTHSMTPSTSTASPNPDANGCSSPACEAISLRAAELEGELAVLHHRLQDMIMVGIQPRLGPNGMLSRWTASPAMAPIIANALPIEVLCAARTSRRVREVGATASVPIIPSSSRSSPAVPDHRTETPRSATPARAWRIRARTRPSSRVREETTAQSPSRKSGASSQRNRRAPSIGDTESDESVTGEEVIVNIDGASTAVPSRSGLLTPSSATSPAAAVPNQSAPSTEGQSDDRPGEAPAKAAQASNAASMPFRLPRLGVFDGDRTVQKDIEIIEDIN